MSAEVERGSVRGRRTKYLKMLEGDELAIDMVKTGGKVCTDCNLRNLQQLPDEISAQMEIILVYFFVFGLSMFGRMGL